MSDPGGISRLDKWRATREYLAWQLRLADQRVRELEAQEKHDKRRREQALAEQSWKIQPQRSSSSALLHRGNCTLYKNDFGYINREEAVIALAEPDIEPCQICNPQTGLK
ncbi:DUF6233 domain-containing protein [Streptomyces sp. QL37]|uniref:DUF6233 domain-containing protein n=1 Tax=Streptomyces sp. QL37 TaxID=2093747 RepID=UPI000CF2D631|nr:DUF6233 domain-containing protein [Streptomyces sp. QL37]PPQ61960.1 hypothetical protein C5F59_38870 [Streptomyces sp. QL37]